MKKTRMPATGRSRSVAARQLRPPVQEVWHARQQWTQPFTWV